MSARRVSPEAPSRRGWCPGLARPMPTGDGLLARVHPPLGLLAPAQLRAVARAAEAHGNGHVDLTARANLQIRGVGEATQGPLAADLGRVGLGDARADGGPQRLTLTSPFCGLDPSALIDAHACAARIEALGRGIAPLPPKTLVAIEAGGLCGLPEAEADIHVRATRRGHAALGLGTGAAPHWGSACPEAALPEAVAALLAGLARSGARRMRDLDAAARARLLPAGAAPPSGGTVPPPGPGPLAGERAFVAVEAPFGRVEAAALARLADRAEALGVATIRLAPGRGFVLGVPAPAAEGLLAALAADFVTAPDDPRRAVAACPGAPACASGSTPTQAHAARLAEAFRPFAAQGRTAHVSGCSKGCARPGPADLTLVAREGRYALVWGGAPGEAGNESLTFEAALERVRGAPWPSADPPSPTPDRCLPRMPR